MRGLFLAGAVAVAATAASAQDAPIIHDAEYYILQAQHAEQWAEDGAVLAAFCERNAGNPPNIISILIDDLGFGDTGIPELDAVCGYETPNINAFSDEGMRIVRMHADPRRADGPVASRCVWVWMISPSISPKVGR